MQDATTPVHLTLLDGFAVHIGGVEVPIPPSAQRLLALLGLRPGAERRGRLAGTLWPEKGEARASANLRSVVWRLPDPVRATLTSTPAQLGLGPSWVVDAAVADREAAAVLQGGLRSIDPSGCRADLLPSWDEPWLEVERERFRQQRLHVLEQLAENLLQDAKPNLAVCAALLAVEAEPLRESAQQLLVAAHLAEGNRAAAADAYDRFAVVLESELGLTPGPKLTALLAGAGLPAPSA